jgi:hypothetical protein
MHPPSSCLYLGAFTLLLDLVYSSPALVDRAGDLKEPVVVVKQTPFFLSTLVCSNTALTFGDTTINVTAVPTLLVTSFNAVATSTVTPGG